MNNLVLNLYHVKRTDNKQGYDTYSAFIVACYTEQEARETHPNECRKFNRKLNGWSNLHDDTRIVSDRYDGWIPVNEISSLDVEFIGKAKESFKNGEVIMSLYNAG